MTITNEELANKLHDVQLTYEVNYDHVWLKVAARARELLTPDPITEMERGVVEAAMREHVTGSLADRKALTLACDALAAARKPPDPVAELIAVAVAGIGRGHRDYWRLGQAIAKVKAMQKDGK